MAGKKAEIRQSRTDPALALQLAGEIRRAMSLAESHGLWPETSSAARPLGKRATALLEQSGVFKYFESSASSAGSRPAWRPELIPSAAKELDRRIHRANTETRRLEEVRTTLQKDIVRLPSRRKDIEKSGKGIDRKLNEIRKNCVELKHNAHSKEKELRDELDVLNRRLAKNLEFIKTTGAASDGQPALAAKVDRCRTGVRNIKARVAHIQSEIARGRLEWGRETDRLRALEAKRENLAVHIREIDRTQKDKQYRLAELTDRLRSKRREAENLAKARAGLEKAGEAWSELKGLLSGCPSDSRGLSRRILHETVPNTNGIIGKINAFDKPLREASIAKQELAANIRTLISQVENREHAYAAFKKRLDKLSGALDRDARETPVSAETQGRRAARYNKLLRDAETERARLLLQREKLISGLGNGLMRWDERTEQEERLASDRRDLVEKETTGLRAQATRRSGLVRLLNRRLVQTAQLWAGLIQLIGYSKTVQSRLLSSTLLLSKAENDCETVKQEYETAHQALMKQPNHSEKQDNLIALAREKLAGLKLAEGAGDAFDRLPRQMAGHQAAVKRNRRIESLEAANRKNAEEFKKLSSENKILLAENSVFADKLAQVSEQLAELETGRKTDREDLAKITRDRADKIQTIRNKEAELAGLAEEKQILGEKLDAKQATIARLNDREIVLRKAFEQSKSDLAGLNKEKAATQQSLEDNMALSAELASDKKALQAIRDDRERKLSELSAAYSKSRDRFQKLLNGARRLNLERKGLRYEVDRLTDHSEHLVETASSLAARVENMARENEEMAESEKELRRQLSAMSSEIKRLEQEKSAGLAEFEQLNASYDAMREEKSRQQEELTRLTREKNRLVTVYRERNEEAVRLSEEKTRLAKEIDLRKVEIADLNDSLALVSREKSGLEKDRDRLTEEKSGLLDENDRLALLVKQSQSRVSDMIRERDRLHTDLSEAQSESSTLGKHLTDEVYPLIKTLGMALHRGRVQFQDLKNRDEENRDRMQALSLLVTELETGKKDAQMAAERITGEWMAAARETEIRQAEIRAKHADHVKKLSRDVERVAKENGALEENVRDLSNKLDETEVQNREANGLINRQAMEIQAGREWIEQLGPLVSFFLNQVSLWNPPQKDSDTPVTMPEGSEFMMVLVHMLRTENEELKEKLLAIRHKNNALAITNDHLSASHEAIKGRLEELLPAFGWIMRNWLNATAGLAEARTSQREALAELNTVKSQFLTRKKENEKLDRLYTQTTESLAMVRESLRATKAGKEDAESLARHLNDVYQKTRAEADALSVDMADGRKKLADREEKLEKLQGKVRTLSDDNKRLGDETLDRKNEIAALLVEIDGLKTALAANATGVESAWAGVGAMADHVEQALSRYENKLNDQAETIHAMEIRLTSKNGRIEELENLQDRLGLLLWTLVRQSRDENVKKSLSGIHLNRALIEAAGGAGHRIHGAAAAMAGRVRGDGFQQSARKAVRRGLYSLLLAGGLIFAVPDEASVATGIQPEELRPQGIVRMLEESSESIVPVAADAIYNSYIGREFDISFITPEDRSKGFKHVQSIITGEVNDLAGKIGLPPTEYVKLIRKMVKPGEPVQLSKLKNHRDALLVLRMQFPNITADLKDQSRNTETIKALFRLAAKAGTQECLFWDRLYKDFRGLDADAPTSLKMVLNNARLRFQKPDPKTIPEFGGMLSPLHEVENLNVAGFTRIMAPYFRANVRAFTSLPKFSYAHDADEISAYARTLAQDMYVASEAFGVPRTFMIAIAHQESYFANVLGDHSMSASPFQIYAPTKPYIIRAMAKKGIQVPKVPVRLQDHVTLATYMAAFFMSDLMDRMSTKWSSTKKSLCDLDRVALGYNGGPHYPPAVYRKKVRLINYLQRVRETAKQKKTKPRA